MAGRPGGGLRFGSDFWVNLHHVLYAAAWADRPAFGTDRPAAGTVRPLAGALPEPLAGLAGREHAAWQAAVAYYDRELAPRHLLFDPVMRRIGDALLAGGPAAPALPVEHRGVLEAAAPVYRDRY